MSWLIHVSSGPLDGHLATGSQRETLPSFSFFFLLFFVVVTFLGHFYVNIFFSILFFNKHFKTACLWLLYSYYFKYL